MKKFLCVIIFIIAATQVIVALPHLGAEATEEIVHSTTQEEENDSTPEPVEEITPQEEENESSPEPPEEITPQEEENESSPEPTEENEASPTPAENVTGPPTPAPEESCIGECPIVDPLLSVYLPHEECDKFCQCSNGEAHVIECPDGLHFNLVDEVCDWPLRANCTGVGGVERPPSVLIVV